MKNVKKKSVFSRMISLMAVVLSLSLVLAFTAVSVSAADVPAEEIITMEVQDTSAMKLVSVTPVILPMSNQTQQQTTTSTSADSAFDNMVDFITTWFTRIGMVVALIGGIMFGFGIKDDNADTKQRGLMTLVAGLVVAAICLGANTIFGTI